MNVAYSYNVVASVKVIYFGDQIYADLQNPRYSNGWYTGAIIHELKREIDVMNGATFANNVVWIQTLERLIERMQVRGIIPYPYRTSI